MRKIQRPAHHRSASILPLLPRLLALREFLPPTSTDLFPIECLQRSKLAKFGLAWLTWLRLVEQEGVGSILCLQQDSDMAYFSLDLGPILRRAEERGDVHHIRYRINDFDAFDLRMKLPEAAATVAREVGKGRKVYIHCTAGEPKSDCTLRIRQHCHRGMIIKI